MADALRNKIYGALGDPQAPWYGSDLVAWVGDLIEEYDKQAKRIKELDERIEALEQLLVCYRVGENPSEALHRKLEKTKQVLKGE